MTKKYQLLILLMFWMTHLVLGQNLKVLYQDAPYLAEYEEDGDVLTKNDIEMILAAADYYILTNQGAVSLYEPTDPDKEDVDLDLSFEEFTLIKDRYRDFRAYKDFSSQELIVQTSFFFRKYLIKDKLSPCDWSVTDSTRLIAGYQCRMAIGTHPLALRQTTVWYTDQIPVSDGPGALWGLPGLIIEAQYGNVHLVAKKISYLKSSKELRVPTGNNSIDIASYHKQASAPPTSIRKN